MVVMVIEAAKQTASKSRQIKGFQLRDTTVSSPIVIADQGSKTETQLYMRPLQNPFDKDCPSSEFRICVIDNGNWKEACRGVIQVEYDSEGFEVDSGREEAATNEAYKRDFQKSALQCTQSILKDRLYQTFRDMGLDLGPSFQALQNISYDGSDSAVAEIETFDWVAHENQQAVQPHTIHPTTLDAAVQLSWVSLTKGCTAKIPTTIPTRIKRAWISNSGLGYPQPSKLRVYCTAAFRGSQGAEISSFALDERDNVKLIISHLESSTISNIESSAEQTEARRLCYYMDWKSDAALLNQEQILDLCKSKSRTVDEPICFFQDLDLISHYFIIRALNDVKDIDFQGSKYYFQKYIKSLHNHLQKYQAGDILNSFRWDFYLQDASLMTGLIDRIEGSPLGKAHVSVGRNLLGILKGEIDPLELLFSDGLAEGYYQAICNHGTYSRDIQKYIDLLAHKNPGMRVLEVGAGKGSFTDFVLPTLHHEGIGNGTERFASYDYTDISESFFEQARERFAHLTERIGFKIFNVENDPATQGFEENSYDLVLACCVGFTFTFRG